MSKFQEKVKILKNTKLCGNYFKLSFKAPQITKTAAAGQFMQIKVSDGFEPLLRKPLGIHKAGKSGLIEVLYEAVGKGTEILSKRMPGEYLDVIGPLGNGFDIKGSRVKGQGSRVLVAGGIGVAPLVFLAKKLVNIEPRTQNIEPIVLLGAKTKSCVLCEKEFKDLGCDVKIATDDGSRGHKGFVTDLLKEILFKNSINSKNPMNSTNAIYACGPNSMLKVTTAVAARHNCPCQVLLEEYLACGVGACLGCAVKVKTQDAIRNTQYEYKMVCKDGPVFEASEVVWQ